MKIPYTDATDSLGADLEESAGIWGDGLMGADLREVYAEENLSAYVKPTLPQGE